MHRSTREDLSLGGIQLKLIGSHPWWNLVYRHRQTDAPGVSRGLQYTYIWVSCAQACGWKWWWRISCSRSAVYSSNRTGPRTETCRSTANDNESVADALCKAAIQPITIPSRPYHNCNLLWDGCQRLSTGQAALALQGCPSTGIYTLTMPEAGIHSVISHTWLYVSFRGLQRMGRSTEMNSGDNDDDVPAHPGYHVLKWICCCLICASNAR